MNNQEHQRRIPRPLGLTISIQEEKRNQGLPIDKGYKHQLTINSKPIQLLLQNYMINDMRINNKYYSFEQIANYLSLPMLEIVKECNNLYLKVTKLMGENQDDKAINRGFAYRTIQFCFESHARAKNQAIMLSEAQNGEYVPFLTSEANRAIKHEIDTIGHFLDLLGHTKNSAGININNNFNPQENTQNNIYLTQEKALEMINSKRPINNDNTIEFTEKLDMKALPEVDARYQTNGARDAGPQLTEREAIKVERARETKKAEEINEIHDEADFRQ